MNQHHQSSKEFEIDNYVFMECLNGVVMVHGDFVEFGVYKGDSFLKSIKVAKNQGKHIHAFDSFHGLAKPTEKDFEPVTKHTIYVEGLFDQGGPEYLISRLSKSGYTESDYTIWAGFIPEIFGTVKDKLTFSFAYVDLDHYKPMKYAMEWVWERLSPLGFMVCDDFFINELWGVSALAITEFMEKHIGEFDILRRTSRRIALRKR